VSCPSEKNKEGTVLPVSINNYYGDPLHPEQVPNTIGKLVRLQADGHKGPVALITKGWASPVLAHKLKEESPEGLVALISISNCVGQLEPVPINRRMETMRNLVGAGIPTIAYIRPLIGVDGLERLFTLVAGTGVRTVIISGFRAPESIAEKMGVGGASVRVKQMPPSARRICQEQCSLHGLQLFERTACGAAYALGIPRPWNPYWISPHTAGCLSCPLRATCYDAKEPQPSREGMDLVTRLGYQPILQPGGASRCSVQPDRRLECLSCCTSCFLIDRPRVDLRAPGMTLGDVAFCRFLLGGVLVSSQGVVDGGDPKVGHVNPPNLRWPEGVEVHAINTWLPLAKQTSKCFGCRYCITPHFENVNREYGMFPKDMLEWVYSHV